MPGPARPRFDVLRSLPRMSWRPLNLYMLWRRSLGPVAHEVTFKRSSMTLFQQRWLSKRLVRGYHGDHIPEKVFKRWFLPQRLPDVRPHKTAAGKEAEQQYLNDKFSGRDDVAKMSLKRQEREGSLAAMTPLSSLMFMELERRLDTFIFRCCFAPSVYQARQLVIHQNVNVNGVLQVHANYRLSPGDMVSVDPNAMTILRQPEISPDTFPSPHAGDSEPSSAEAQPTSSESPEAEASPPESNSEPSAAGAGSSTPSSSSLPSKPKVPPTFRFPPYAAPFLFLPAYIEANFATCSAIYLRHPTARPHYSEIPSPFDAGGEVMRFAWEWYAKNRSRERGTGNGKSRWTNPQNTRK